MAETSELAAAMEMASSNFANALQEGLGKLTAARENEGQLHKAEVVGTWYLKPVEGAVQWATLPPTIKALFDNVNPLEQGQE